MALIIRKNLYCKKWSIKIPEKVWKITEDLEKWPKKNKISILKEHKNKKLNGLYWNELFQWIKVFQ